MSGDPLADYLAGLPENQRAALARVNGRGLAKLAEYLASGEAVAFLGAGASRPLYPLWSGLIGQLVDAGADRLSSEEATTCRALAAESPEEVVEILRQSLGAAGYREVLREVLKVQTDPVTGRSWTPVQELVCRCPFKAVVTTNYDPGIVDARMRVRLSATGTGFTTWADELEMDRWRTGDAFGAAELPILYAHGLHSQPDSVVLAASEYRRAYAGKLSGVLGRLVDAGHLVWIGFSFADRRIAAILQEIRLHSGTRAEPGSAPRHVAVMPWDPAAEGNDPKVLARQAEIRYAAQVVLYPAPDGDHSALQRLLSSLTDPRFSPAAELSARASPPAIAMAAAPGGAARPAPVTWAHGAETVVHFTGRQEELARLDRWATDPQVDLVGVTAWGGAGKTALVTHWVQQGGASMRPGVRGGFGWSFYADPSAEHWAAALLEWAGQEFGIQVAAARPANAVLSLLRVVPLLLVLDGLEVVQEGPAGDGFGRLLDGMLREVLTGACRLHPLGLVMLTSRFPFADLESFDGSSARMLDVPAFTPADGAALLAAAGGNWLDDSERRDLVAAVDGHALAVGVLAGALADRPAASDLATLRAELTMAARTDARVGQVLRFYSERLSKPDRFLVAAVSLFARPVPAEAVVTVARHWAFDGQLAGWTPARVMAEARDRLGGLVTVHRDGTLSAHPLVRDYFRQLAIDAAEVAAETTLTGLPRGQVTSRADALRVVEVIELLLDASEWRSADELYRSRSGIPAAWITLPAARLGQRAAAAFVGTAARRDAGVSRLSPNRQSYYLNNVGVYAMNAGDLLTAREYLSASTARNRAAGDMASLAINLRNLAECLGHLGEIGSARAAAAEALACVRKASDQSYRPNSHAFVGWLAGLSGDSAEAEEQFTAGDEIEYANDADGDHLYWLPGCQWADWLACTGRTGPSRALTQRNRERSVRDDRHADVARCDRVLGRLALAGGDTTVAGSRLTAAADCFRDGDYLTELGITLTDLAEYARLTGDLGTAERHAAEAIAVAAPRGLVPAQSAGLAARARICADLATATHDPDHVARGRDAADAALRLATRRNLAWCELDALRGHASLDQAEGTGQLWAGQAAALHARLIPAGLDPDPLATVERRVAARKAAEKTVEKTAVEKTAAGPDGGMS